MEVLFDQLISGLQGALNPWNASAVIEYTEKLQAFDHGKISLSEKKLGEVSLLYSQNLAASIQHLKSEVFCSCLDLYTDFIGRHGHTVNDGACISDLFRLNGFLTVSYHYGSELIDHYDLYLYYMNGLQTVINSESFRIWLTREENVKYLQKQVRDFLYDLINFCINKREICFFELTEILLCLRERVSKKSDIFQPMLAVFSRLKNSYILTRNGAVEQLRDIFLKYASPGDEFILKLQSMYPEPSEALETGASELTPEIAFEIAFEEVFADMKISNQEQVILNRLKEFIRISPLHYKNIFTATATKIRQKKGGQGNKDFSSEEFLYKAALKAFEDGVLTMQEKRILRAICNALDLDSKVVKDVIMLAQQDAIRIRSDRKETGETREAPALLIPLSDSSIRSLGTAFGRLVDTLESEEIVKGYFDPETDYSRSSSYTIVKEIFRDFDRFKEKYNPSESFVTGLDFQYEGADHIVVTDFVYDPKISSAPAIVIFSNSDNIHNLRTQFKGNFINCYFTENIPQALVQDPILRLNCGSGFSMYNVCLARQIQLNSITVFDNLERFLSGLVQSNGHYDLVLVHYDSLSPFLVIHNKGFLESTSTREKAFRARIDGNYEGAISILERLVREQPLLQGICRDLGICYELLGKKHVNDPEKLIECRNRAREYYERELKKDNKAIATLNSLAKLLENQGDIESALEMLKNACTICEAYIPGLCNYAELFVKRAKQNGNPSIDELYPVLHYLCSAYHIDPENERLRSIIEPISKRFGTDFINYFKLMPVDTRYQ